MKDCADIDLCLNCVKMVFGMYGHVLQKLTIMEKIR